MKLVFASHEDDIVHPRACKGPASRNNPGKPVQTQQHTVTPHRGGGDVSGSGGLILQSDGIRLSRFASRWTSVSSPRYSVDDMHTAHKTVSVTVDATNNS